MFLWISVFNYPCFYGYPLVYPWIYADIHPLTCHGFSIQGKPRKDRPNVGNVLRLTKRKVVFVKRCVGISRRVDKIGRVVLELA